MRNLFLLCCLALPLGLSGCATAPPPHADYSQFRSENPHSILVVPVTNKSVDVDAPNDFLSTISIPLAERGYYVFPVNAVKNTLAENGLSDADLVSSGDPRRLAELFGADAVLYTSIERWDARYAVLSTTVTVDLTYTLKSGRTGKTLWSNHQVFVYSPQASNNSGGGLGGLIASLVIDAVQAAATKANPDYLPLARQANANAIYRVGTGLPAGPYDGLYGKDGANF